MKNTNTNIRNKTTGKIRRTAVSVLAAVMMMTTAASFNAFADNTQAVTSANTTVAMVNAQQPSYNGHEIIDCSFTADNGFVIPFKYTDGVFETDPSKYDPHMATMLNILAEASTTVEKNNNWSKGSQTIENVFSTCGFENIYVSDSYNVETTPDSIACALGSKKVQTADGERTVISITVRSASYKYEWCSNVTLGTSGEAKGFSDSAGKVLDYLNDYFKKNPKLEEDLNNKKVSFWLPGFSRGGAVTNLTAKRLIDKYQANGTKIYAYALPAPKGGVEGTELSDRDYSCIHNIINKEDIVPYVAPAEMGFKRYSVDYYTNHISDDRLKEELKKVHSR